MQQAVSGGGPLALPELPWAVDALAPVVSARTIELHHGEHHRAYIDKTNALVKGTRYADMPLDEIVKRTLRDEKHRELFNNAGQAWNHSFFWPSLSPRPGAASPALRALIDRDFGGLRQVEEALEQAAVAQFGSGWAWLVFYDGKLAVQKTANADTPMAHGRTCLLTVDVWEHAYYLDYQNRRPDYAKAIVKRLDWAMASDRLAAATG